MQVIGSQFYESTHKNKEIILKKR